MDFSRADEMPEELLVFYHPDTLRQISALRKHLLLRERAGSLSAADRWVRMAAVTRLTGHSPGFFSVYTLPPNQAVSARAQAKINSRLNQNPPRRDVATIILTKTRSLLRDVTPETIVAKRRTGPAVARAIPRNTAGRALRRGLVARPGRVSVECAYERPTPAA